jgi:hypothetical protein
MATAPVARFEKLLVIFSYRTTQLWHQESHVVSGVNQVHGAPLFGTKVAEERRRLKLAWMRLLIMARPPS